MSCELVTDTSPAFPTIAWKTPWGVSHERPQAPPDIYKKESFIWNKEEGIDLVEAMENADRGFEERSVMSKVLNVSGRVRAFPTASQTGTGELGRAREQDGPRMRGDKLMDGPSKRKAPVSVL